MTGSNIRLLANENFPGPAIRLLRERGIDVVWVAERMPAATDAEVLACARAEGRWLLTFDRDYGELVFFPCNASAAGGDLFASGAIPAKPPSRTGPGIAIAAGTFRRDVSLRQ